MTDGASNQLKLHNQTVKDEENKETHRCGLSQLEITDEGQMFSERHRSCLFSAGQVIQPTDGNVALVRTWSRAELPTQETFFSDSV